MIDMIIEGWCCAAGARSDRAGWAGWAEWCCGVGGVSPPRLTVE